MDRFALHQAAREGDLDGVRLLIEGGASVDSLDDKGRTPLHWAAEKGRCGVADLLVSSKCDPNVADRHGNTPVMLAATGWLARSIVDLLLQRGAQVNHADHDGFTLLHHVAAKGWTEIVRRILDRGEADLNAATTDGLTPLMWAAIYGQEEVAAVLIQAGADVHRSDVWKNTVLHWVVRMGSAGVVRMLLEMGGLDLNFQEDESGWTPLHFACLSGDRAIMVQLLVAGADTTLKDNEGETALSVGISRKNLTLEDIKLFVQHGAFFQDCDYVLISEDPLLKESVLRDASLCAQSIVNKFHRQSLPALNSISYFARKLPNVDKFQLNARQIDEVENLVRCEIKRNNFCNVVEAHPMALSALCVLTLITCQSGPKRSASP